MKGRISMNISELERIDILKQIIEKRLKMSKGAKLLGLSIRQTKRLKKRFKTEGPKGVVSRKVGAPSNNRIDQAQESLVVDFLAQKDHKDFGPTLTHEYLKKGGQLRISISSVRDIMIKNDLWDPNELFKVKIHRLRARRAQKGELIQLDGSEHDWFEGRGSRCTLLVFIDDATSETMHLKFVKSENVFDYFQATREYIEKHGRPEAFYPDKHAVFRVNREDALNGNGMTQFGRAMMELEIELICANSPQAKGRVERRNRDFQDRLVKALRLAKICNIEAANAFLPPFLEDFNQKFAKVPKNPNNAHRALLATQNLDRIFCLKQIRQLSKNLTLQYKNIIYQIIAEKREHILRKAEVVVLESKDGTVQIEYRGKNLTAVPYHKMQARNDVVSSKELGAVLSDKKHFKPSKRHPWKRHFPKVKDEALCV